MSSTRELRRRIKSIKSTRQITKAMELISTTKMRRATEGAISGRPYAGQIRAILADLLAKPAFTEKEAPTHPLLIQTENPKTLVVAIASDRGLAGAYNTNIMRQVVSFHNEDTDYIVMGKKLEGAIIRVGYNLIQSYPHLPTHPTISDILPITQFCLDNFLNGSYGQVHLVYTHFKSMLRQDATREQLLPLLPEAMGFAPNPDYTEKKGSSFFLYEPNRSQVLDNLLPRMAEIQLYQAVVESLASEHSARRLAMKSATDNAGTILDDLTLTYNSLRQSAITSEIAEITGGAAALQE